MITLLTQIKHRPTYSLIYSYFENGIIDKRISTENNSIVEILLRISAHCSPTFIGKSDQRSDVLMEKHEHPVKDVKQIQRMSVCTYDTVILTRK